MRGRKTKDVASRCGGRRTAVGRVGRQALRGDFSGRLDAATRARRGHAAGVRLKRQSGCRRRRDRFGACSFATSASARSTIGTSRLRCATCALVATRREHAVDGFAPCFCLAACTGSQPQRLLDPAVSGSHGESAASATEQKRPITGDVQLVALEFGRKEKSGSSRAGIRARLISQVRARVTHRRKARASPVRVTLVQRRRPGGSWPWIRGSAGFQKAGRAGVAPPRDAGLLSYVVGAARTRRAMASQPAASWLSAIPRPRN